jgi:hypothetical protein
MISAHNHLRVLLVALIGLIRAGESLVCQSYVVGVFSNVTLPGIPASTTCSPNTTLCAAMSMAYNTTLYSNHMLIRGCNGSVVLFNHPTIPTLNYTVSAMVCTRCHKMLRRIAAYNRLNHSKSQNNLQYRGRNFSISSVIILHDLVISHSAISIKNNSLITQRQRKIVSLWEFMEEMPYN